MSKPADPDPAGQAARARPGSDFALEAFDDREGYCRKLGHHVSFAYCRRRHLSGSRRRHLSGSRRRHLSGSRRRHLSGSPGQRLSESYERHPAESPEPGESLPCPRIADCWFERLPVEAYLKANYSTEELGAMLAPPAPKLQSILEIVARVQARTEPRV